MSSDRASASDERDLGVFIPSFLDDYGLDPYEFRIYSHIARRAGGGVCFEGLKGIARCCLMDIKTVRQKVAVLIDMGMLKCSRREGMTHEFTLTRHSEWEHPETLEEIREKHTPTRSGRGTKSGTGTKKGTTRSGTPPLPDLVPPPLPDLVPKGSPIKGIPLRESHEGTIAIAREEFSGSEEFDGSEVVAIPQTSERPEPVRLENSNLARKGQNSAAPPAAKNSGSAAACDRGFQEYPWGFFTNPNPEFLDFLVKDHLPNNPGFRDRRITTAQAKSWVNKGKFCDARFDDVAIAWEAFEEYRSSPVQQATQHEMTSADKRAFTQMANLKAHLLAKHGVQNGN